MPRAVPREIFGRINSSNDDNHSKRMNDKTETESSKSKNSEQPRRPNTTPKVPATTNQSHSSKTIPKVDKPKSESTEPMEDSKQMPDPTIKEEKANTSSDTITEGAATTLGKKQVADSSTIEKEAIPSEKEEDEILKIEKKLAELEFNNKVGKLEAQLENLRKSEHSNEETVQEVEGLIKKLKEKYGQVDTSRTEKA